MDENCLFCKIGAKKIPSKLVYEDDDIFAFEDISPQSPTHILICPRKHFAALHDASPEDQVLLGKLQLVAAKLATERNLLSGLSHRLQQRFRRWPVRLSFASASSRWPQFPLAPGLGEIRCAMWSNLLLETIRCC